MNREIILRRLSMVKLLYRQGVQLSHLPRPISCFSILSFDDSIEMFLKLAAEHKELKSGYRRFEQYLEDIPDLTLQEQLKLIHRRRNFLKHEFVIPDHLETEGCRMSAGEFFEQNCEAQFGIAWEEVSLVLMIEDVEVKASLTAAEEHLKQGDLSNCLQLSATAFLELLHAYQKRTGRLFQSKLGRIGVFHDFFGWGTGAHDVQGNLREVLNKIFGKIANDIQQIEEVLLIHTFGFDYRRYLKFKALTPNGFRTVEGKYTFSQGQESIEPTPEDCSFCIDYVIECSLKLQEFDFDHRNYLR